MHSIADRSKFGFFGTFDNPYYIYAPGYTYKSAGVRSLHYLCNALNDIGHEAYVATSERETLPRLRTPSLTPEVLRKHYLAGKHPIAIYPETTSRNPLALPFVIRWLLNRPGALGGPKTFSSGDDVYYMEHWMLPGGLQARGKLTIPFVDQSIFNNDNNPFNHKRTEECYYANKLFASGTKIPDEIVKKSTSLCQDIPRSPQEIASIFRQSRIFRTYEHTALIIESLLCGCPVLLMPSEHFNRGAWHNSAVPLGAGWADEENVLVRIADEAPHFRRTFEDYNSGCRATVLDFIAETQRRAAHDGARHDQAPRCSEDAEPLWAIPAAERAEHLDAFLQAYARHFSTFQHWTQGTPVLKLAHWLEQAIRPADALIARQAPAATVADTPPPAPLSPAEENRLLATAGKLLETGRGDAALAPLTQLVSHGSLRWEAYDTLGQLHAERGELDHAADILLKGTQLEFSSTHCLRKLAAVYAMKEDLGRTLAACAHILKREPDDAELHLFVRDVLISASPRFDDISWLAPEWSETLQALVDYKGQAHAARNLLDALQNKIRAVQDEYHPLTSLGSKTIAPDTPSPPQPIAGPPTP